MWIHASLGYPAAATWLKACREGNLMGFPFADVTHIRKYYPENDKTPAGRMTRQQQKIRSTKSKPVPLIPVDATTLCGKKERDVYIKVVDPKQTLYHTPIKLGVFL